jgi:hypothetical protein
LAELAAQVAAGCPERKHRGPGKEVIERFLFDRIDAEAAGSAISGQNDLVFAASAHEAEAALALVELAVTRTKIALNAPVF